MQQGPAGPDELADDVRVARGVGGGPGAQGQPVGAARKPHHERRTLRHRKAVVRDTGILRSRQDLVYLIYFKHFVLYLFQTRLIVLSVLRLQKVGLVQWIGWLQM